VADAYAIRDSERPLLPLDTHEIEKAHALLLSEDLEINGSPDIMAIIQLCLKNIKALKHHSVHTIKMLTQLTAVSLYVERCAEYKSRKICKQPCLKASIAIAHRMGKGIYFACQIHYNELYLLKHHRLPSRKQYM